MAFKKMAFRILGQEKEEEGNNNNGENLARLVLLALEVPGVS
jgi:hypothetical protein